MMTDFLSIMLLILVFALGCLVGWTIRDSGKYHNVQKWNEGHRIGYRSGYMQGCYDAMRRPDCGCAQDDEPPEEVKWNE